MSVRQSLRALTAASPFKNDIVGGFTLPLFLCPGLQSPAATRHVQPTRRAPSVIIRAASRRSSSTVAQDASQEVTPSARPEPPRRALPLYCPGCGALAHSVVAEDAGFYDLRRKTVREYMRASDPRKSCQDALVREALKSLPEDDAKQLGLGTAALSFPAPAQVELPICDRCHKLKHHDVGRPIIHPSIDSIVDAIDESPHKYNHIYHIIDAADFPMSIVPGIHRLMSITPQRSLNRRSKSGSFIRGKRTEVSFIITRSDLLAPLASQVNSMMPYLVEILRECLGRAGRDVRLGNVKCVSAIRGWWTKELKEEIWNRGGAGWMVGKVNVGKSQLMHVVFPKGRQRAGRSGPPPEHERDPKQKQTQELTTDDLESLLPSLRPETAYPDMPLVSALPGTTASPIRIPFGSGKGELIDLPGLDRSGLIQYVRPEQQSSLVMRSRVKPEQQVIKPGKSLLLGGMIRITPTDPDMIILAYNFTPLVDHLTSTEKAIGIQSQTRESTVENIGVEGLGDTLKCAGTFHLKWDVTRHRTGPLTARDAVGLRADRLPYRVLAMDLLVEGVGWVELVAQVRKRKRVDHEADTQQQQPRRPTDKASWKLDRLAIDDGFVDGQVDESTPSVDVFTPEGRFVAARRPMNAWAHIMSKPKAARGRPRRSMKGVKKRLKAAAAASTAPAVGMKQAA